MPLLLRVQGQHAADAVLQEWSKGRQFQHRHLVNYVDLSVMRDFRGVVSQILQPGSTEDADELKQLGLEPGGLCFCLAMEHTELGTLKALHLHQPLSVASLCAAARQLASALNYIHGSDCVHHAMRPDNIFLAESLGVLQLKLGPPTGQTGRDRQDRQRDRQLLAYTVWCLAMGQEFDNCPRMPAAFREFLAALHQVMKLAVDKNSAPSWQTLTQVIEGLWMKDLDLKTVEFQKELQGLQIPVPDETVQDRLKRQAELDLEQYCQSLAEVYASKAADISKSSRRLEKSCSSFAVGC